MEESGEQENFLAHALGVGGEGGVAIFPEADEAQEFVHLGFQDPTRKAA